MRIAVVLTLLALPATSAPAQETGESPWVCVPTERYGWICGRGASAPEPRHLPVAPPASPEPLPDYRPPERSAARALIPDVVEEALTPGSAPGPAADSEPAPGAIDAGPESAVPAAEAVEPTPAQRDTTAGPRFGVQLAAMRDKDSLDTFILEHGLEQLDTYRRSWRDEGGVWYVLLTGKFPTVGPATRALEELPVELQQAGAWVRRVDGLDER